MDLILIRYIDVLQIDNDLILCNLLPCQCYSHFSIEEKEGLYFFFCIVWRSGRCRGWLWAGAKGDLGSISWS